MEPNGGFWGNRGSSIRNGPDLNDEQTRWSTVSCLCHPTSGLQNIFGHGGILTCPLGSGLSSGDRGGRAGVVPPTTTIKNELCSTAARYAVLFYPHATPHLQANGRFHTFAPQPAASRTPSGLQQDGPHKRVEGTPSWGAMDGSVVQVAAHSRAAPLPPPPPPRARCALATVLVMPRNSARGP